MAETTNGSGYKVSRLANGADQYDQSDSTERSTHRKQYKWVTPSVPSKILHRAHALRLFVGRGLTRVKTDPLTPWACSVESARGFDNGGNVRIEFDSTP